MSFREKTAWVTLCAIMIVSLLFWLHVPNPFRGHANAHVLHSMFASFIAYVLIEVAANVVLRLRDPKAARQPKDERERLIDLKAMRFAYYVLVTGTTCGIFVTLHLIGAGHEAVSWVVFMSFVISQMVKHAARVYYFRRDA